MSSINWENLVKQIIRIPIKALMANASTKTQQYIARQEAAIRRNLTEQLTPKTQK